MKAVWVQNDRDIGKARTWYKLRRLKEALRGLNNYGILSAETDSSKAEAGTCSASTVSVAFKARMHRTRKGSFVRSGAME